MSSRHRPNRPNPQFDENLYDPATAEWRNPAPATDSQTMHGLHLASQNVLHLAMQTYNAAARGDESAAHAARESLVQQLGVARHLIDELISCGTGQPTMH
ncbi:hypothetical protein [Paraburkholderia phenoliruptrix]|uniref:Uncharacterized protein n=2 Tax=Paraburkholderia phenoliruptrix TaxID=252970 RepID=K0DTT8_9BURK|nr:hypothetical protein [Paraburkholderia phenoliruptrix]AFT88112.1 hypothetical protein BUPH_00651 [Paraburkholderia phenoliruptrix BR3459a]MDR6418363.1 hypothetical protein [Paraburkholderia phenoliruptrix]CAB4047032.1 hypothetical protein LMG9964_00664 [Paraburkholderia phenoliruptrix]